METRHTTVKESTMSIIVRHKMSYSDAVAIYKCMNEENIL